MLLVVGTPKYNYHVFTWRKFEARERIVTLIFFVADPWLGEIELISADKRNFNRKKTYVCNNCFLWELCFSLDQNHLLSNNYFQFWQAINNWKKNRNLVLKNTESFIVVVSLIVLFRFGKKLNKLCHQIRGIVSIFLWNRRRDIVNIIKISMEATPTPVIFDFFLLLWCVIFSKSYLTTCKY